jgi:hypothetical protein
MQTRINHWSHAASLASAEPSGKWIGAGRGTFPFKHYKNAILEGKGLVSPKLTKTDSESFLSLTPGKDSGVTYVRQRLTVTPSNNYKLRLRVRGAKERHEYLIIEFCERHVLKYLPECTWSQIEIPKNATDWRVFNRTVKLGYIGKETFGFTWRKFGKFTRPVDIAILNRGIRYKVDIAEISLVDLDGNELLRNGSFEKGIDHWFISYGDHLRWHIKNVFVYFFYESGFLGLSVFILMLAFVGYRLLRRILNRDGFAVLYASSLVGIILVGMFDSLFDEPRIGLLIWLVIWLALIPPPEPTLSNMREQDS